MTPGSRGSRLAVPALVALAVVLGMPGAAGAAPPGAPAPVDAAPGPPEVRCETSDRRLAELSGLVWAPDGLQAIVDSGRTYRVFRLAADCSVADVRSFPPDPRDVEDLARAPDGTLWLADIGDNDRNRDTVALLEVPPSGRERLLRFTYPDGPHDAEALLLAGDGSPVIVTKELGGTAGIYTATVPGSATASVPLGPIPLRGAGTVVPPASQTRGGPAGPFGGRLVTGGAVSPDGRIAVLRTYTDAWLYPVVDGDVVAALQGTPVGVPLPDEPQGEAVTLTPDGTLLSGSESTLSATGTLRAVPGAAAAVGRAGTGTPTSTAGGSTSSAGPSTGDGGGLGGAGVAAAVAVLVVALGGGAVWWRRRR